MPKYTTVIDATGQGGNIFAILGEATNLLRKLGASKDVISKLRKDVMESSCYDEAVKHIEQYFSVEGE